MKLFAIQFGWDRGRMSDWVIQKNGESEMIRLKGDRCKWVACHPDADKPSLGDIDWQLEIDGCVVDHHELYKDFLENQRDRQYDDPYDWYR
jgi:hypothetical protein